MNYYKKALELLRCDLQWRDICFAVASLHPKAFLDGVENLAGNKTVYLAAIGPKRLQVIKIVCNMTGLGLRAAKELVDSAAVTPVNLGEYRKSKAEAMLDALAEAGATVRLE